MRELIILGTAAQVPTRDRNHNGYFLRWDASGFLFDPGEGTQRQMTYADLPASAITHICLTHFHGDHCLGLPGVVQRLSLDKSQHPVHAYFPKSGACFFDAMTHASLFQQNVELLPHPVEAPGILFQNDDFILSAQKLEHRTECYGYRLQETEQRTISMQKLAELGIELQGPEIGMLKKNGQIKLQNGTILKLEDVSTERPSQCFAYVMDTRPCEGAIALAQNADILICEATYLDSEEKQAHEYMHMTARQAAKLARDANANMLVLSHFSQRYLGLSEHLHQAREVFENTHLARDLDHFQFPKRIRNQ